MKPKPLINCDLDFDLPENVEEEGKIVRLVGYTFSPLKNLLSILATIFTGGFYFLFCKWNLKLNLWSRFRFSSIENATHLLIFCQDQTIGLVPLKKETFKIDRNYCSSAKLKNSDNHQNNTEDSKTYRTFEFRLFKYFYDERLNRFIPIKFSLKNLTNNQIHELNRDGFTEEKQYQERKPLYGLNSTEVKEKPILQVLWDEILSPFYIFQVFSCILWYYDEYQIYASVIAGSTVISIAMTLWESYTNMKNLRKMSYYETLVQVHRKESEISNENCFRKKVSSLDLVPGDIIDVPENSILPCDLILLQGVCIVNECILTGESVPVLKSALPLNDSLFNPHEDNKNSILFSGTKCMEIRGVQKSDGNEALPAMVFQTGFNTMKGQFVRSILFPKNNVFQFYQDSLKFVGFMAIIAILGLIWSIISLEKYDAAAEDIVIKCLDIVTIVVPPALPACMAIGVQFALKRLKRESIFCISPMKINIAGRINTMCFDKTGTLTQEGFDTYGVRGVKQSQVDAKQAFTDLKSVFDLNSTISSVSFDANVGSFSQEKLLLEVLASCQSLAFIRGELVGDPFDIKMFESTGWTLEENTNQNYEESFLAIVASISANSKPNPLLEKDQPYKLGILKRFEFSSQNQRMSVIVRNLKDKTVRVNVKGSPEKLKEICLESSIPLNFREILEEYSKNGYRVLACASKELDFSANAIDKYSQENVEKDVHFVGFLIMENKLKARSREIISQLHTANVRTIMVTGDNALTAVSVAKQCNIINPKQKVYLGEMIKKFKDGKSCLIWRDLYASDQKQETFRNPESPERSNDKVELEMVPINKKLLDGYLIVP